MSEPKIRELRVTDIRCSCGAGPGELCLTRITHDGKPAAIHGGFHWQRTDEHEQLVAEGWQWQEVDPRDAGAR
jgi:hypothetical protein